MRIARLLGQENEENVAWMRICCDLPSFHHSGKASWKESDWLSGTTISVT